MNLSDVFREIGPVIISLSINWDDKLPAELDSKATNLALIKIIKGKRLNSDVSK